mgnify:FL=1
MALLVTDTSVILKWYKEEIYSEIAVKIKDKFVEGIHEIVVPDLILYELANAMRYDKGFGDDLIKQSIRQLVDLEIDITIPAEGLISESVDYARKYDISIYDAVYVALANQLDAMFVTADKKLFDKIKGLGFAKFITDMESDTDTRKENNNEG